MIATFLLIFFTIPSQCSKFSQNRTKGHFLITYEKHRVPEQKSLQTAVFLIRYSYTVFVLDSTNEPNCDLQKKSVC